MKYARLVLLGIFLSVVCISAASASDYWYYKKDGSQIEVTALEDVVSIRLDSLSGPHGAMFAQLNRI